jgi:hypothetical protein
MGKGGAEVFRPYPGKKNSSLLRLQCVIAASDIPASADVLSSRRAVALTNIGAIEQALAFSAPSPIGLTGRIGIIINNGVSAASVHDVISSLRAYARFNIQTEEEALTIATPSPISLSGCIGIMCQGIPY